MAILPGAFGHYTQIEKIGEGSFGEVYRATDTGLKRQVALKVPRQHLLGDPDFVQEFVREAQLAAQLQHPNIVTVYRTDDYQGIPLIEMQYVAGETIADLLKREGKLTPAQALPVIRQVCAALSAAHAQDIVHGDLKPGNILIRHSDDEVLVTDFGLAKVVSGSLLLTKNSAASLTGTPRYMAPEQLVENLGEPGTASDQYSLGIVVYELLTGRAPFEQATFEQLTVAKLRNAPTKPSTWLPSLSRSVDSVILRALQKAPKDRFKSVQEFCDQISLALAELPAPNHPTSKETTKPISGSLAAMQHNPQSHQDQKRELFVSLSFALPVLLFVVATRVWPKWWSPEWVDTVDAAANVLTPLAVFWVTRIGLKRATTQEPESSAAEGNSRSSRKFWFFLWVVPLIAAFLAFAVVYSVNPRTLTVNTAVTERQYPSGPVPLQGTGALGDTVEVSVNGIVRETTKIAEDGHWAATLPLEQPGQYVVEIRAIRPDGNLRNTLLLGKIWIVAPTPMATIEVPTATPVPTPSKVSTFDIVAAYQGAEQAVLAEPATAKRSALAATASGAALDSLMMAAADLVSQQVYQELSIQVLDQRVLAAPDTITVFQRQIRKVRTFGQGDGLEQPLAEEATEVTKVYLVAPVGEKWKVTGVRETDRIVLEP